MCVSEAVSRTTEGSEERGTQASSSQQAAIPWTALASRHQALSRTVTPDLVAQEAHSSYTCTEEAVILPASGTLHVRPSESKMAASVSNLRGSRARTEVRMSVHHTPTLRTLLPDLEVLRPRSGTASGRTLLEAAAGH